MVSGMNGVPPSTFKCKVGWVRKATFVNTGVIGLTHGTKTRLCTLALDRSINPVEAQRIRSWFTRGPANSPIPIDQLAPIVPHLDLAREMDGIEVIAVSPRFKINKLVKEGRMLALRLADITPRIKQSEQADAEHILHEEARTLFLGDDGVDHPATASGTLFDVGFQSTAGGKLLQLAAENFFPLQADKICQRDSAGFYDWMIDNIGIKLEMIGTFALELSIAREMVMRGQLSLDSPTLARIKRAYREQNGRWMKLELRNSGAAYLENYEQDLMSNVSKKCAKIFRKLSRANKRTNVEPEGVAVLTLAVAVGKLQMETAIEYLKGVTHPNINLDQYLDEVKNYLSNEADRLFSLKALIQIISSGRA